MIVEGHPIAATRIGPARHGLRSLNLNQFAVVQRSEKRFRLTRACQIHPPVRVRRHRCEPMELFAKPLINAWCYETVSQISGIRSV
jgi:hypothetical protein